MNNTMQEITADTSTWNHLWAMEPQTLRKMLAAGGGQQNAKNSQPYAVNNGIALIPIVGPICKYPSLFMEVFGGCSTMELQKLVAKALGDDEVKSITLYIDSPGGMVSGTSDLATFIETSKLQKPINAYVSDNCASAAYWIASACSTITANKGASIGSIGVYSVLTDTSVAAEQAGVKVHLVSAGEYKGLLEPGLVIDDKALGLVKDSVNAIYDLFLDAVSVGRNLTDSNVRQLADGKMHIASQAKSLGLIDAIASFDSYIKGNNMGKVKANDNSPLVKASADADKPKDETVKDAPQDASKETPKADDDATDVSDGEKQILAAIAALSDKLDSVVKSLSDDDSEDDGADDSSDGESADDGGDDVEATAKKAVASDRARLKAISDAVGNRADLAIKTFLEGKSPTEAKAALADLLGSENEELRKKAGKPSRGVEPLAVGATSVDSNDPEYIWANNIGDVQKSYSGKKELFLVSLKYKKKGK